MDKNTASKMPDQTLMDKKYMPTGGEALNDTEMGVLKDLDPDKLSDMAEVLYAFNNYKVGPMPGFYVAFEVTPGKEWCVGQLCAERDKQLKLLDKEISKKTTTAQKEASRRRQKDTCAMGSIAR